MVSLRMLITSKIKSSSLTIIFLLFPTHSLYKRWCGKYDSCEIHSPLYITLSYAIIILCYLVHVHPLSLSLLGDNKNKPLLLVQSLCSLIFLAVITFCHLLTTYTELLFPLNNLPPAY